MNRQEPFASVERLRFCAPFREISEMIAEGIGVSCGPVTCTETSAALASTAGSAKQKSERSKDLVILYLARANRSNRERTVQRSQGKRGSGGEHSWRERTACDSLLPGLARRDGLSAA